MPQEGVGLEYASTGLLPKARLLHRNPLFHRARKFYFWMVSFLGKLTGRIGPFYLSDF